MYFLNLLYRTPFEYSISRYMFDKCVYSEAYNIFEREIYETKIYLLIKKSENIRYRLW